MNRIFILTSILFFLLTCSSSFARYQIDITPSITITDRYDDNIDLEVNNKISDYTTTVSPGLTLDITSGKNSLQLRYTPSIVRYREMDQNDTTRQSGAFTFFEDISSRLRFELSDTYLRSEEQIESTDGIIGIRSSRNLYQRNNGRADMSYSFGPNSSISFGYNHSLMENDDITLDDGTVFDPYISLVNRLNSTNGMEFNISYSIADFTRDDGNPPGDDYRGISETLRYIYNLNPHTSISAAYGINRRNFKGESEDYCVYDGDINLDHNFSARYAFSLSLGGFKQKNKFSNGENGFTGNFLLRGDFNRGNYNFGINSGWNEVYLEADRRGFTKYKGLTFNLQYQVTERISNYTDISYRYDEDTTGSITKAINASYGWSITVNRWYTVTIDYSCFSRDENLSNNDYIVNQITLNLGLSKPFRW